MNLMISIVTLAHLFVVVSLFFLLKTERLKTNRFFLPLNILFLFTILYIIGFYARYFFYYPIYFEFIQTSSYIIYATYVFLYFLIFCLSYFLFKNNAIGIYVHKKLNRFKISYSVKLYYVKSLLIYLFATVLLVVLIKKTGILPFSDPLEFRIQAGHHFGILFVIMLYFFSLPLYIALFLKIHGKIGKIFYFVLFSTIIIFFFFGSRMLLLSLIVNTYMIKSVFDKNVASRKSFIIKAILLAAGILFVVLYSSYRDISANTNNFIAAIEQITENFGDIFIFYISEPLTRFSQFVHFLWVIDYEQKHVIDMQYGQTLINFFTTFIPRFLYEDKPLFLSMEIQKILSGDSGIPKTASGYFFAEPYLNLYWYSLPLYPWLSALVVKLLTMLYRISVIYKNFVFLFLYKDLMWYLYVFYDGINSISFQMIMIFLILNITSLLFFMQRKKVYYAG